MVETQRFREKLRTWLLSIPALSALVDARVTHGWPMTRPTWPLVTFHISRTPSSVYGATSWEGIVRISLSTNSPDQLDTLEEAITDWLGDGANYILDELSDKPDMQTAMFQLTEIPEDEQGGDMQTLQYMVTTRNLMFTVNFMGLT